MSDQQPAPTEGKGKRGNSQHHMPPPESGTEEPKRKGLTLEALRKATTNGNIPLAAPVSVAVIIEVRKPEKGVPFMAHTSPDYTTIGYTLAVKSPTGVGEAVYLMDPDIAAL